MTLAEIVDRRLSGTYSVDPWGADTDWVDALSFVSRWMVRTDVVGVEHLPVTGPALLVVNRRIGVGEVTALVVGIRRATGRLVRPLGVPDITPAPLLRRFGAVQSHPAEIASLLRAGELVAAPLAREWRTHRCGTIASEVLAPALRLGVSVIPVGVAGGELTGQWRVAVGPAIAPPTTVRGRMSPLAVAEAADRARAGVQALFDEAFPPRWFGR